MPRISLYLLLGLMSTKLLYYKMTYAEMAELADAHGSGPCDSNIMRVQVPSSARHIIKGPSLYWGLLLYPTDEILEP